MPQEENTYMNYVMYLHKYIIACVTVVVGITITKCELKRSDFRSLPGKNFQIVRLLKN